MKVSVLSAVYNEALHLPEMLDSVRAQSHQDWEVVFVSDGSTDGTRDILAAAASSDPRIRVVGSGAKIGKAAAFNAAFAASTGHIVVLLAGDDTLPPSSLALRVNALRHLDPRAERGVAFGKLTTISQERAHHGMILPRGTATSHSGGTITLTRALAEIAFPVEPSLVSEDPWLSRAAEGLAQSICDIQASILNYRIHPGNSNPRMGSFAQMSTAMAQRHEAWRLLAESERLDLEPSLRDHLARHYAAELLRRKGRVLALVRLSDLSWRDRAAFASQAHPWLFRLRQRHFSLLSGRRGR